MAFSKKDLGLLLPDEVGDAATMRFTKDATEMQGADYKPLQPKIDPSKKVSIYRAGKAPQWAKEEEEADMAANIAEAQERRQQTRDRRKEREEVEERRDAQRERAHRRRTAVDAEVLSGGDSDSGSGSGSDSDSSGPVFGGRSGDEDEGGFSSDSGGEGDGDGDGDRVEGDVVMPRRRRGGRRGGATEGDQDDEDAVAARRAMIRNKMLQRRKEEEELLGKEGEDGEEAAKEEGEGGGEGGESSEWETDTDESEAEEAVTMLKPVFVPKGKRETIKLLEEEEKKQEERDKQAEVAREERVKHSRSLVAEAVRREADEAEERAHGLGGDDSDAGMPSDGDEGDEEEQRAAFTAWKAREIARLKRDKENRERLANEKAETERRRKLTPEERRKEDAALGKGKDEGADGKGGDKLKFMQRYYHKGAFYMDEASLKDKGDVRHKDYKEATGEDKFDKSAMPKAMQVKNFGRRGQTKYTHLKDQDTTDYGAGWAAKGQREGGGQGVGLPDRLQQKLGGADGGLDGRPKSAKSRKAAAAAAAGKEGSGGGGGGGGGGRH